jgi:hypothetical protein
MALTLNGTKRWPETKHLGRLGETRMAGTPSRVRQILERIDEAVAETTPEVRTYINDHPDFAEIGERMLAQWTKVSE